MTSDDPLRFASSAKLVLVDRSDFATLTESEHPDEEHQ